MKPRKSALEQAQETALSFAFDDDDDVSVISFESSSGVEEGELKDQENTNTENFIPNTTSFVDSSAHKQPSLTLPKDSVSSVKSAERNTRPSQTLDKDEELQYQWARARALASVMQAQPGTSSEDDDEFSVGSSSTSVDSVSRTGPKPPKREKSFDDYPSKADEIFSQMQNRKKGEFIVSRKSLPPSLTRYESGESTNTNKSAQSIKSFPLTVKRTISHSSSSYRDPRHRKDYGRQSSLSLTRSTSRPPKVARAVSVGTSVSSISTSSFQGASVSDASKNNNEKEKERMADTQFRQSFCRTMEERLQMRTTIKERRYDEENQHRHQEEEAEEEEEEDKPPSDNGIVTAETQVVPASVTLDGIESATEDTIVERRKMVHSLLIYSLLGIIAIATISILVVILSQKDQEAGGEEQVPLMEDDSLLPSSPTVPPEVVPEQVLAVVPRTICMEQVPGDGWSTQCDPEQSILQGGGVCNLVAQSFLEQVEEADIAFQSSTSCLGDIVMGNFTVADAYQILPHNERLWNIEVTGMDIITVLEQVLEATFGVNKGKRDYPYAAGLRFAVNASAPYMSRISEPEVNRRLEQFVWEPLDLEEKYIVVASRNLLMGGNLIRNTPYAAFEQAYKDQFPQGKTWMQTTTTFIEFAEKKKVLRDPPFDTYSTTLFTP